MKISIKEKIVSHQLMFCNMYMKAECLLDFTRQVNPRSLCCTLELKSVTSPGNWSERMRRTMSQFRLKRFDKVRWKSAMSSWKWQFEPHKTQSPKYFASWFEFLGVKMHKHRVNLNLPEVFQARLTGRRPGTHGRDHRSHLACRTWAGRGTSGASMISQHVLIWHTRAEFALLHLNVSEIKTRRLRILFFFHLLNRVKPLLHHSCWSKTF